MSKCARQHSLIGLHKYLGSSRQLSRTPQDCNCPLQDLQTRKVYLSRSTRGCLVLILKCAVPRDACWTSRSKILSDFLRSLDRIWYHRPRPKSVG